MTAELVNIETELVKLIPSTLWFLLVLILVLLFYRPIRDDLLPGLTSLKAGGVELSFVKDSIDAALELSEKSPQWKVAVSSKDKEQALKRARKHLQVFHDAQFLWVDDHPENNVNEQVMFRQLKVKIQIAESTDDALNILKNHHFDLVISDMGRGDETTAGLKFLSSFAKSTRPPLLYSMLVCLILKKAPLHTLSALPTDLMNCFI